MTKPRITMSGGCMFYINKQAAEKIGINKNDFLMLTFNYKEKRVIIRKDNDPDESSFKVCASPTTRYISSRDLYRRMVNCFNLKIEDKCYFDVVDYLGGFKLELCTEK